MEEGVTNIYHSAFLYLENVTEILLPESITEIGPEAFKNCSSLESIVIPEGVESIGEKAFYYCTSLKEVTLPTEMTSIGEYAFYNCSALKKLIIPEGITEIGMLMCNNCSSLEEVKLPYTLLTIGNRAFYKCGSLKDVTLPSNLVKIAGQAFEECIALEEISIPDSVTTLYGSCFEGCTGLQNVVVGSGITEMDTRIFYNCSSLKQATVNCTNTGINMFGCCSSLEQVTLSEGLEVLGSSTFFNCSSLEKIKIPDSVETLERNCFEGCSALTEVTFGSGIKKMDSACFRNCSSLETIVIPDYITDFNGNSQFEGCSSLKQVTLPKGIIILEGYCFANCTSLEEYIIPEEVTEISYYCFYGCSALESIQLPENLLTLGRAAFQGCSSLTELTIPGTVSSVEQECFKACSGLKQVIFQEGTECTLGDSCFESCTGLEEVAFADRVTCIGDRCFYNCSNIQTIRLDDSVKELGESAFVSCTSLKEIYYNISATLYDNYVTLQNRPFSTMAEGGVLIIGSDVKEIQDGLFEKVKNLTNIIFEGNSVKRIGKESFYECSQLAAFHAPEGLEEIGDSAFERCKSLADVTLGEPTPSIGHNAFKGTSWLADSDQAGFIIREGVLYGYTGSAREIVIPDTVTEIADYAFFDAVIKTITIPSNVTIIGANAFSSCDSLSEVEIGEGVTTIEASAFYGCSSLKQIEIPDSVTAIGAYAFDSCGAMEQIKLSNGLRVIEDFVFADCKSLVNIVLPEGLQGLGESCFQKCVSLEQIEIPTSVEYIESNAFYNCTKLEQVTGGDGVTKLGYNVFFGTPFMEDQEGLVIFGKYVLSYNGNDEEVVIPEGIQRIYEAAFIANETLKRIVFPDSLIEVGNNAFEDCSVLEQITWGTGLEKIGSYAFYGNVVSVMQIPEGVKEIGEYAFGGNGCPTEIRVPASVERIEENALGYDYKSIHYDGLEYSDIISVYEKYGRNPLGNSALVAEKLEEWYEADGVNFTSLEGDTIMSRFARLTARRLIEDGSVTDLKEAYDWLCGNCDYTLNTGYHFSYEDGPLISGGASCQGYALVLKAFLDEFGIPNFVMEGTCYGRYGYQRHAWNNVYIGGTWYHMDATDTKPGDYSTYMMTDSTIDYGYSGGYYIEYSWSCDIDKMRQETLESWDYWEELENPLTFEKQEDGTYLVNSCSNTATEVIIPSQVNGAAVTAIGEEAFAECTYLEKVTIPEGIVTIGSHAFSACIALEEVTLPSTVTTLGTAVFDHCISLKSADLEQTQLTELEDAFYCCISLRSVRLPKDIDKLYPMDFRGSMNTLLDGTSGLTIYGYSYSGAESFAEKNSLKFVSIGVGRRSVEEAELTIDAAELVYNGEEQKPALIVELDGAALQETVDYTVEYSNNINAGTAKVLITGIGDYRGCLEGSFDIGKATPEITIENVLENVPAGQRKLLKAATSGDGRLTFTSDNKNVLTVDLFSGEVIGVAPGKAVIIISSIETSNYLEASLKLEITVSEAISLEECSVVLSEEEYTYDGTEKKPAVVVTYGETVLEEGADYSIAYERNIDAGKAQAVITGQGGYAGTKTVEFIIHKAEPEILIYPENWRIPAFSTINVNLKTDSDGTWWCEYDNEEVIEDCFILTDNGSEGNIWQISTGEAGTATLNFHLEATDNYEAADLEVTITVYEESDDKGEQTEEITFADVSEESWQYTFAKYAVEHALMSGKGKDESGRIIFDPNASMTRAEFVQTLYNKEGKPEVSYTDKFADVPAGAWYTNAILWAAENNIVAGKGDIFDVNGKITRQEMATILYKYAANYKGYEAGGRAEFSGYTDADSISGWAVENMRWALCYGIMKGKGERIAPIENATRAECATMLKNFIDAYGQN